MIRPDFLITEEASVYHSQAHSYLSSHRLADFRKCPELFTASSSG